MPAYICTGRRKAFELLVTKVNGKGLGSQYSENLLVCGYRSQEKDVPRMSQEMDFKLTSGPWNFNYLSWELASHHHETDWYLMNKTVKDF